MVGVRKHLTWLVLQIGTAKDQIYRVINMYFLSFGELILLHINESSGEGLVSIFKEWIVPKLAKMESLFAMSSLSKRSFSIVASLS